MASKPGIFTDWPWKPLGSFKYLLLAPLAIDGTYDLLTENGKSKRDLVYILVLPFLLVRLLHNQIWISLSRYRTSHGKNIIVDRALEFDQVDRERHWDDQLLFTALASGVLYVLIPQASGIPVWRTKGLIITALLHAGPVEFLYYWFHRALHHHFLYSRYHSHHHSSIVTEPISSIVHPFAEHMVYALLFLIPIMTTMLTRTASIFSIYGYILFIDFMNNLGHCNFEFIPNKLFSIFPPLKYLMYTPSFHSLHHTQFRTNYSLFMPFYDFIYGTVDKSTNVVYQTSLEITQDYSADVVHLTHLIGPQFLYYGISSVEYSKNCCYFWLLLPITWFSSIITLICGRYFVLETNTYKEFKLQSWLISKYILQYSCPWKRERINNLFEECILDADRKGVKVLSLGLMIQGMTLNKNGEFYIQRHPNLNIKVVDGSSLVVAIVVNNIPENTAQVLLRGNFNKITCAIAKALCQKGIEVATLYKNEYEILKLHLGEEYCSSNLVLSTNYSQKIWVVGDGWTDKDEQMKAAKGTIFIPFSQFPPKKLRKDCLYHTTPAMRIPRSIKNIHSCENWLPRRVMSAWRIAGIVHAIEGWNVHECGQAMFPLHTIWEATLRLGFQPLIIN